MKVEVGTSRIHGTGVFAIRALVRGDVILSIDDSRIVDGNHPLNAGAGEKSDNCDYLPDGTTVLMPEPERHINHSCEPNAYVYSVDRDRFVLALRDISVGEEVTCDYAINASGGAVMDCRCGAGTCRQRHTPVFFALPVQMQLERLPFLDPWFASIHKAKIADLLRGNLPNTASPHGTALPRRP